MDLVEKKFFTKNSLETQKIAYNLAKKVLKLRNKEKAIIFGLIGNLGSGKTTFTKGFAKGLGIKNIITSPTFVLEKIYKISNKKYQHLIHIDAYRIEKAKEILDLGLDKLIENPKNIILIEWAEKVLKILPKKIIKIKFLHSRGDKRKISIVNNIGQTLWTK